MVNILSIISLNIEKKSVSIILTNEWALAYSQLQSKESLMVKISNLRRGFAAVAVASMAAIGFTASSAQAAENQACGWASERGYTCTTVNHNGTYVDHVWSIRTKTEMWPWAICNSSAWVYYIPPWGGAYGLAYGQNSGCISVTARYKLQVNRWVPSGSRVCSKFMENGRPVGSEPCATVW